MDKTTDKTAKSRPHHDADKKKPYVRPELTKEQKLPRITGITMVT